MYLLEYAYFDVSTMYLQRIDVRDQDDRIEHVFCVFAMYFVVYFIPRYNMSHNTSNTS